MTGPLVAITGASSGIGLAIARAFAAEGNALLLIARHMKPIDGLPEERTVYAEADVADYAAVERAIRGAEARFGKTACLVNNAGLADARGFHDVDPASFSHEIDVNLKGVFNCTKAVIGDMSAARSGTIINISSVSDRKTSPVALGYTASKYGVRAFGESLREAEGVNGTAARTVAKPAARTTKNRTMAASPIASGRAARQSNRRSRASPSCRSSRPRHTSPAAGTDGTWSRPGPRAGPA